MSIRGTAERLTHHLVLRRRLPEPFRDVRIRVSSEAGLRYLKPSLRHVDPSLLGLVDEFVKPGAVVWDIGANVGLFAFAAAHRAGREGRVIAVDPDAYNVGLLRRSAAGQPATSAEVTVVPCAISDRTGVVSFQIAARNRSTNAMVGYGTTQMGGVREVQTVPTLTLDLLADFFPSPDVIKIDVEAAEIAALSGASRVLAKRPIILCEVAGETAEGVAEILRPLGYHFYDGDKPSPRSAVGLPPVSLVALA